MRRVASTCPCEASPKRLKGERTKTVPWRSRGSSHIARKQDVGPPETRGSVLLSRKAAWAMSSPTRHLQVVRLLTVSRHVPREQVVERRLRQGRGERDRGRKRLEGGGEGGRRESGKCLHPALLPKPHLWPARG